MNFDGLRSSNFAKAKEQAGNESGYDDWTRIRRFVHSGTGSDCEGGVGSAIEVMPTMDITQRARLFFFGKMVAGRGTRNKV